MEAFQDEKRDGCRCWANSRRWWKNDCLLELGWELICCAEWLYYLPYVIDASQVSNTNHFQLDVQNSLDITLKAIDFIYQNRIFIARSLIKNPSLDQLEALKVVYINIAARRAMTFVDVEKVILDHHSLIKNELEMRWTDLPPQFPSNYQPNSVVKLIQAYLQSLPSENKDILLWGYPSADHRLN